MYAVPLGKATLDMETAKVLRNNSVRSILSSLELSESSLQSILNQPNEFLNSSMNVDETERIHSELIVAYRKGFRVVFLVVAGLAAVATLIVVCLMPQVPLDRPDDEKLKEEGRKADEESKGLSAAA